VNAVPAARESRAGTPEETPFYRIDPDDESMVLKGPLSERDWERVLDVVKERQITVLHAGGQMTDVMVSRLAELTHLTDLDLSGSRRFTDAGVGMLASVLSLQRLNVSGSAVTDLGLQALPDLPDLRTIALAHHPHVTDAGISHLRTCRRLEFVDLMGTRTGDESIVALTGMPGLRRFHAGNNVSDAGLRRLQDFPAFKEWSGGDVHFGLDEQDMVAGDEGFMALRASKTIEYINGRRTYNLGSRGLGALASMPACVASR
jgi:hypothetical protein